MLLEVHDLKKHFPVRGGGTVRAVDGVSFAVDAGQTYALVGESGCGKTTIARQLLLLERPSAGTIRFDGQDVLTLGRKGAADHIHGVNLTPLKELLAVVQDAGVPIWVCGACAVARGIEGSDLVAGASIKGMPDYIKAVVEREKTIAF